MIDFILSVTELKNVSAWGWAAAVLLGLLFLLGSSSRGKQKKAAQKILSNFKKTYERPHTFREVLSTREYSYLDLEYYRQTEEQLKMAGFITLGDWEDTTLSLIYPNLRTFIRSMTNPEGTIATAIYHVNPMGGMKIKQKMGLINASQKVVDFSTTFSDGTTFLTSNARKTAGAFDFGPKRYYRFFPLITDAGELLRIHQQRVQAFQIQNPQARPEASRNLRELFSNMQDEQARKAEWRNHYGWGLRRDELEKALGHPLSQNEEKVFAQMQKIAPSPPPADYVNDFADDAGFESTEVSEENPPDDSPAAKWYPAVREAMVRKLNPKRSWTSNLLMLAVTLLVFFNVGWIQWGFKEVLILIGVLFVHELGHYAGMRLFGYRDVRMFFIPLFGAAVSGHDYAVSDAKKAIVTLMGPLPGILISIGCWIAYGRTSQTIYRELGIMFLGINAFNLLPFVPLDGGRFLEELLFSRNRYIDLVTRTAMAVLLLGIGIGLKSWILGILGFLGLMTLRMHFRIASIAAECKRDMRSLPEADGLGMEPSLPPEDVPEKHARAILGRLLVKFANKLNASTLADAVLGVWKHVNRRPAGVFATVGLILLFLGGYFLTFISVGAGVVAHRKDFQEAQSTIVEFQDEQGQNRYKEQVTWPWGGMQETELSNDKQLYHGRTIFYRDRNRISMEGQWDMGRKDGEWRYYDGDNQVFSIDQYDHGRLVYTKINDGDQWTQTNLEDLPEVEQAEYLEEANGPPQGPEKSNREDFSSIQN